MEHTVISNLIFLLTSAAAFFHPLPQIPVNKENPPFPHKSRVEDIFKGSSFQVTRVADYNENLLSDGCRDKSIANWGKFPASSGSTWITDRGSWHRWFDSTPMAWKFIFGLVLPLSRNRDDIICLRVCYPQVSSWRVECHHDISQRLRPLHWEPRVARGFLKTEVLGIR